MFSQNDTFQLQLNDLQRSYNQLGKGLPGLSPGTRQKRTIRRVSGIEEAKTIARDELLPGEEDAVFDSTKDQFYAITKKEDGTVNPVLIGSFTLEQAIQSGIQQVLLSSANNNYETAMLLNGQTRDLMAQNYTNQINVVQGFNQITQSIAQLGFHMDECCCKLQTQLLQSQYDEALRELAKLQADKSNADQTAYLLSVMGKWQANPAATTA